MINQMAKAAKKVLIVEDNKLLQQVYFDRLLKEGYTVLQSYSGQQGLVMAHEYHPDLILLDIMLPGGLNGFDVLTQIKRDETLKKVPVIMLTDLKNQEKTAHSLGASDYIVKHSAELDDIVIKIKTHIGQINFIQKIKNILT